MDNTRKILILSGLMLVIFAAFYFFLWRPGMIQLNKYRQDLSKKSSEMVQLEKDARDWPNTITREKLVQYEEKLSLLWSLIPTEEGISLLLDEVQNHARASGLDIMSLKRESGSNLPRTEANKTGKNRYEKIPYKMQIRGSYFGLTQFIRKLEDSNRLIVISKLEAQTNNLDDPLKWSYTIEANVEFSIFYSRAEVEKA